MAFEDDWNELWDTIIGRTEKDLGKKAQKLAEESQQFNEQFSEKQLLQQKKQFEKSQTLAENNLQFQKESADRNFQMQQDVFNAQQRENELTRQREDTAYQRQVADLKAAGLSPLMASNGAAATNVQVGEVPQYDSSGIQNAYGSYIQMAREYAELKNMAEGQYLSRRQEAINQRIGATMALAQMSQSRRQMYWNNALSGFNLVANISGLRKRNMLLDQQIKNTKDLGDWNNEHGWRNENLTNYLISIIDRLVTPSKAVNIVNDALENAVNSNEAISNVVSQIKDAKNAPEYIKEQVTKKVESVKQDIKVINNIHKNKNALAARYAFTKDKREKALKALYSDYSDIISEYNINMNQFKKLSAKQVNEFLANPMKYLRNWN